MPKNADIGPVAKEISILTRHNDRLRTLLPKGGPGSADICEQQTKLLRDLIAEFEAVKRGGSWWRLNELIGQAQNVDPIVLDMIEIIEHPELAQQSRDWADENLP